MFTTRYRYSRKHHHSAVAGQADAQVSADALSACVGRRGWRLRRSRFLSGRWVGLLLSLLLPWSLGWAASLDRSDETWGDLYHFMHSLFTGTPANIISLLALALGIFGALVTHQKMLCLLGAVGIPIAIQVGPSIFEHLSGAVL